LRVANQRRRHWKFTKEIHPDSCGFLLGKKPEDMPVTGATNKNALAVTGKIYSIDQQICL